jgi:hypothetical protein
MKYDNLSVAIAKVINEADVNVADGLYGLAIACAGCFAALPEGRREAAFEQWVNMAWGIMLEMTDPAFQKEMKQSWH